MAELAAGPAATDNTDERARRQDRLQRTEATFDPLPVDVEAARAYGRIYAAVRAHDRRPRRRFADLLIAAIAVSNGLPLVTRNAADFDGLGDLVPPPLSFLAQFGRAHEPPNSRLGSPRFRFWRKRRGSASFPPKARRRSGDW